MPRLDQAHKVFVGDVEVDIGISLGRTEVWVPAVLEPQNTGAPFITGGTTEGSTLTGNYGTWLNADTFAVRWQVDEGTDEWVDVGDTDATLADAQAGRYRFGVAASNEFGTADEVFSAAVTVAAGSSLPITAVRFAARSGNAALAESLIAAGGLNFTFGVLVMIESGSAATWDEFANMLDVEFTSGRYGFIATTNEFENRRLAVGGHGNDLVPTAVQPVSGQWYYVTLGGDGDTGSAGGDFRMTIQDLGGSLSISASVQNKGDFFSTDHTHESTFLNGTSGDGWAGIRYQSARLYNGFRSTTQIDNDRTNQDPVGAAFWWDFYDNGSGGLAVSDLTGNGRVPTVTGGELAAGPGA